MNDQSWLPLFLAEGDAWWAQRPARIEWSDVLAINANRPDILAKQDSLDPHDEVHPLIVRAMVAPALLGQAFLSLPWDVLLHAQLTAPSTGSKYRYASRVLDVVLPDATENAVRCLTERALDDAAGFLDDPALPLRSRDLPFDGRNLPAYIVGPAREAWQTLQRKRVRRYLSTLTKALNDEPSPDEAGVQRWRRWSDVLACTTCSNAEANVVSALLHHGHHVSRRMITHGAVLKGVPDMPVGFFASLAEQGIDLSVCVSFYECKGARSQWKRIPEAAVTGRSSDTVFPFHLIDLAALRGRIDVVNWCLDQGMRPNAQQVEGVLALLRKDVGNADPRRHHQAVQRLLGIESLHLRAALTDDPVIHPPTPTVARRRL